MDVFFLLGGGGGGGYLLTRFVGEREGASVVAAMGQCLKTCSCEMFAPCVFPRVCLCECLPSCFSVQQWGEGICLPSLCWFVASWLVGFLQLAPTPFTFCICWVGVHMCLLSLVPERPSKLPVLCSGLPWFGEPRIYKMQHLYACPGALQGCSQMATKENRPSKLPAASPQWIALACYQPQPWVGKSSLGPKSQNLEKQKNEFCKFEFRLDFGNPVWAQIPQKGKGEKVNLANFCFAMICEIQFGPKWQTLEKQKP